MRRVDHRQDGITLVELLISVVLLSMIMGALATSFITALRSSRPTTERVNQTNDAQIIAGFLTRDAQAAGGTDPTTIVPYASLRNFPIIAPYTPAPGVFKPPLNPNVGDYCVPAGPPVAQFDWNDRASSTLGVGHLVIYSLSSHQLIRTSCTASSAGSIATSKLTMARQIAGAVLSCDVPACTTGSTNLIQLRVTATTPVNGAAYDYTLAASLRPDNNQSALAAGNSSPVPLLALGGVGCPNGATGLNVGGNGLGGTTIYGQVVLNSVDAGGCTAMDLNGGYNYSSGTVSIASGGTCTVLPVPRSCPAPPTSYSTPFADPYVSSLQPLADACAFGGPNPVPSPHYTPAGTAPLVFPNVANLGNAVFDAGTFVFCHGINATGTITTAAAGVTFYVVDGGFTQTADTANTTISRLLYAPTSSVDISGAGSFQATAVVAGAFSAQGSPTVVLGTAPALNIKITAPATLPNWTINRPYPNDSRAQMVATGGGGPYTWSAAGLPPSLTIDPNSGLISGTPTVIGTYSVEVSVTDPLGDMTTKSYTITMNLPPSIINPPTLTDWTINRDYPGTAMIASAGTTPYTWSSTGSPMPPGMFIDPTSGVVQGTPSATGTYTPTIKLTDASGAVTTRVYTIKINTTPSITGPPTLPPWTANSAQPYPNQTMTAINGTLPYKWAASNLPPGLVINVVGPGVISGRPTSAGTFPVSVTMTDKAGASDTKNYSVRINPAPGIATDSLPNAEVGRAYNFTLTPEPGTPPFRWSLPSPPAPPAWLSIGRRSGTLTGTPLSAGVSDVTVQVADRSGTPATRTYSLTVSAALSISPAVPLPNWTINRDYPGTQIVASGGVSPLTWSSTPLPAGLVLNGATGVVSGTPSATGTTAFTITVADSYGSTSKLYSVTINPPPTITTASLPGGERAIAYSTTLAETSGTPGYTWAASNLPTGLTMSAAGVLSGTPTEFGTFAITVSVTDGPGASGSKILSLVLVDGPAGVTPATLPDWTVDTSYPSQQIRVAGGTGPFTVTVIAGTLPAGLSLNSASGVVSGTPNATGTHAFTVQIQDALGAIVTQGYSITIHPAPVITTGSPLPAGTIGSAYPGVTMAATGGTPAYIWSATGLPGGMSINPVTGHISGSPTSAGTFASVFVSLTDGAGADATHSAYSLTIGNPPPTVTAAIPSSLGQGATGQDVVINGTGFIGGGSLAVAFSGTGITVNSVTVVDATTIDVNITIDAAAAPGGRDVTLTNGDGSTAIGAGVFTVDPVP